MILIADSGSTKCDWVLINNEKKVFDRVRTKGLNPATLKTSDIITIINQDKILSEYRKKIMCIYFFGAGCNTNKSKNKISKILFNKFSNVKNVYVYEDLMLAALAITTDPAIVCIIGTGSNCCFFDGKKIFEKNIAMGYILMDEGSGNHLGKKLLRKYYYNKMPDDLKFSFEKDFNLDTQKVITKLYNSKCPNRYLAKFAKFLFENKEHPFCQGIINSSVNDFVENQLLPFKNEIQSYPIYFVGSIAYFSQKFINNILKKHNLKQSDRFVRRPLQSFIERIKNGEDVLKNI